MGTLKRSSYSKVACGDRPAQSTSRSTLNRRLVFISRMTRCSGKKSFPKVRIINGGVWGFDGSPELLAQLDLVLNVWHIVERPAVAMPEFTIG
jgi:hypothetical protein